MFTTRENDSSPAHWGETYSRRKPCAFGCASLGIMSPLLLAEILVAFATYIYIHGWDMIHMIHHWRATNSYHLYFLVKSLYPSVNRSCKAKSIELSWIVHREKLPWENRGLNGILIGKLSRDSGESVVLRVPGEITMESRSVGFSKNLPRKNISSESGGWLWNF
jgi:hypothetical protein